MAGLLAGQQFASKFNHYIKAARNAKKLNISSAHLKYLNEIHLFSAVIKSTSSSYTEEMQYQCALHVARDLFYCTQNLWSDCIEYQLQKLQEKLEIYKKIYNNKELRTLKNDPAPKFYEDNLEDYRNHRQRLTAFLPQFDFISEAWDPYLRDLEALNESTEEFLKEIDTALERGESEKVTKEKTLREKIQFWGWVLGGGGGGFAFIVTFWRDIAKFLGK